MSTPKERGILFTGPLVRQILDGEKTQTRRLLPDVFNSPPDLVSEVVRPGSELDAASRFFVAPGQWGIRFRGGHPMVGQRCPYSVPGDLLYVRETFQVTGHGWQCPGIHSLDEYHVDVQYRTDGAEVEHIVPREVYRAEEACEEDDDRWRPSIHMPKWAARIWLRVTDVRVERVQDITEEDARAEGVKPVSLQAVSGGDVCGAGHVTARELFAGLWDQINGDRATWESNPHVWVVSFERVEARHG